MNDSTNKMIEMLQGQISKRDEVIQALKRENEVLSIVNKSLKKKYTLTKLIILIYSILLMISSGIAIYHLI